MNEAQVQEAISTAVGAVEEKMNKEFDEKVKAHQAEVAALKQNDSRRDMAAFVDEAIREGKLPPKFKEAGITDFMLQLDGAEEIQFSEGDDGKLTQLDWFKNFVTDLGDIALFSPLGDRENDPGASDGSAAQQDKLITEFIASEKKKGNEIAYGAATKEMAAKHPEMFTV